MKTIAPRRWLQFRLSTWLVLLAILAWMMAVPIVSYETQRRSMFGDPYRRGQTIVATRPSQPVPGEPYPLQWHDVTWRTFNPAGVYPLVALVLFIGWKGARLFFNQERNAASSRPRETLSTRQ